MSASVAGHVHGDACGCARCRGFQPLNRLAVTHGAYVSSVRIEGRAREVVDELRPTLPLFSPADEPVLRLLAIALVRVERAAAALDAADEVRELAALKADLRGWIASARNLANDLGLTPTSRARLGLDLARAEDTLAQLAEVGRGIRERRGAVS